MQSTNYMQTHILHSSWHFLQKSNDLFLIISFWVQKPQKDSSLWSYIFLSQNDLTQKVAYANLPQNMVL